MQRYQQQVGDRVAVITVHQDENETAALIRMAELGVRLPVLQDGRRSIGAALAVPNVMPATVVLRGDGSLKKLYVMQPSGAPFLDDEAYQAVRRAAPFPNVPNGLKDRRDGLVKFTFHIFVRSLTISKAGSMLAKPITPWYPDPQTTESLPT